MTEGPKRKHKEIDEEAEEPTKDSRGFEALAELTSSEVVEEVKNGLSQITPLRMLEGEEPEDLQY
jgi:hypothetical protein